MSVINRYSLATLGLATLLLFNAPLQAGESPPVYDRIHLSVSATAEVDNDIVTARLYIQRDGENPAKLADEINREMRSALDVAKATEGVDVQTGSYRTNPRYRNSTLIGWQVRQDLLVESANAAVLGKLVGELQNHLNVESIGYRVSDSARKAAEEKLIVEALENFQARASLVSGSLKRKDYRLVQMNINTGYHSPIPVYRSAMMAEAVSAPPAIEAGSQNVTVTVDGTIELLLN